MVREYRSNHFGQNVRRRAADVIQDQAELQIFLDSFQVIYAGCQNNVSAANLSQQLDCPDANAQALIQTFNDLYAREGRQEAIANEELDAFINQIQDLPRVDAAPALIM